MNIKITIRHSCRSKHKIGIWQKLIMILVHILLKNFNANALVVIWKDIIRTMYNQIAILFVFYVFGLFFMVHFKKKSR